MTGVFRKKIMLQYILGRSPRKNHHSCEGGHYMSLDGKCWVCGADIVKSYPMTDIMSQRFCREHWLEHNKEHRQLIHDYLILKARVMHERALRILEQADYDMSLCKREAYAVLKHAEEEPDKYKSSHEMVAAIVLLKAGWDFEMNYKIGRNFVDIFIPDISLIVEIDGEVHEGKELKDSNRDIKIRQTLGFEWEIIRIPTKYIEQAPERLPEAILAMGKKKREIRERNGGILPENYSKREKARYEKAMIYDEKHVKA